MMAPLQGTELFVMQIKSWRLRQVFRNRLLVQSNHPGVSGCRIFAACVERRLAGIMQLWLTILPSPGVILLLSLFIRRTGAL